MSKSRGFVMFIFGAAVGSTVAWLYIKNKYEQIAQEEIDSVKEVFSSKERKGQTGLMDLMMLRGATEEELNMLKSFKQKYQEPIAEKKTAHVMDKPDMAEFVAKVKENGYTNYTDVVEEKKTKAETNEENPYVIAPEEFGEEDEYDTISLTYYSDRILADDDDEIVEDVKGVVGLEALSSFGEYEDDSVFVRNDRLKCDYEILLDQRKYSDVVNKNAHQMED